MRKLFCLIVLSLITQSFAIAGPEYPVRPERSLTPGQLCYHPDSFRYPERIAYCERDVSVEQKESIFASYRRLGFRLNPAHRSSYKIDHYIPLCAGGANTDENLWPQHQTIYTQTDTLEKLICDRLATGAITQKDAVRFIMIAKNDLSRIEEVRRAVSNYR